MYDLSIEGFMGEPELIQIEKWAAMVPENGVIVEVGCFKGRSSVAWASSCHPSVTVYCMDNFHSPEHQEFYKNTEHLPNIRTVVGHMPYDIGSWEKQEIDIFFLDGIHANPADIDCINYFLPLIKKGGLICGHDYYPIEQHAPDIIENVRYLEERLGQKVITVEQTSFWAFNI